MFLSVPARPEVRITHDEGGVLASYAGHYERLRERGERVVVDGGCYSACTLALSLKNVCVTDRARFYFHAPYQEHCWFGYWCRRVISEEHLRYMMAMYPESVQRWIRSNGGLGYDHIVMSSEEAMRHVPRCTS